VDKSGDKAHERVYTNKVRAGRRRTYFFDVRQTKGSDYYITLTESTKRFDGEGFTRHKIFLYKEDFNRFVDGLQDAINHIKTDLMPDYDYEEYDRRQEEWEKSKELAAQESAESTDQAPSESSESSSEQNIESTSSQESSTEEPSDDKPIESEEDMEW